MTLTPTDSTDYTTATQTVSLTVNKNSVNITGISSLTPSSFGDQITITFSFTGDGVTPTGTATILDGETALGSISINAGIATYTTSALTAGKQTFTAVYSGDSNYQ